MRVNHASNCNLISDIVSGTNLNKPVLRSPLDTLLRDWEQKATSRHLTLVLHSSTCYRDVWETYRKGLNNICSVFFSLLLSTTEGKPEK